MVEFARFDIASQEARKNQQANFDRTVVTSTTTDTTSEDDGDSNSGVSFDNHDHESGRTVPPVPPPVKVNVPSSLAPPSVPPAPRPSVPAAAVPSTLKAPPREGWQQPATAEFAPVKRPSGDGALNGKLVVDRSTFRSEFGVRDGSFTGKSFVRAPKKSESSALKYFSIFVFALLAGGGFYYFQNPARAMDTARPYLVQWGVMPTPTLHVDDRASTIPNGSAAVQGEMVDVSVTSMPSGAPIEIDGQPQGEVTPATIKIEKSRVVKLTIKLAGYLPFPYEERFKVEGPKTIDVKFKSDKKGFLNVMVKGEGQIYINDKLVATTSPARMIAVPADEDVRVIAFDPKTKASDQIVATVSEGATKTIVLTPRASAPLPLAQPAAPRRPAQTR